MLQPGQRPAKPLRTEAVLLAGKTLFVAHRLDGGAGAEIWALATADGRRLATIPLPRPPRWDGMAATPGRLFVSTRDGHLLCLAGR